MKMLRCRICGDTYLGTSAPSRCPFCGASAEYFVEPGGFAASENTIQLTELERDHLTTSVEIERSNARFYLAVAALSGDEDLSSAYKRLARVEAEHCGIFSKLLGTPKPDDLATPEGEPADWCAAIAESAAREQRATEFYGEVVAAATNARIIEVFLAVMNVERDHLDLDDVASRYAGCE
ncbi:MAG: ferritin family protein [Coriobacteriia bacterium]|nr:ferritin family protein [Coriobacteriia bacterium]